MKSIIITLVCTVLLFLAVYASASQRAQLQRVFQKSALARRTVNTQTTSRKKHFDDREVWLIGFPGDPYLKSAWSFDFTKLTATLKLAWWELAQAGHVMLAEGPIAEFQKDTVTKKAFGYHPPEGIIGKALTLNGAFLSLNSYTTGAVQDDTHWITRLVKSSWNPFHLSGQTYRVMNPTKSPSGWVFCQKKVCSGNACNDIIRRANADIAASGTLATSTYSWKYSFPNNGACQNGKNDGLFKKDYNDLAEWRDDRTKGACMNCIFWPPLCGVDELFTSGNAKKGYMSDWIQEAYNLYKQRKAQNDYDENSDWSCKCYRHDGSSDYLPHDDCARFETDYLKFN